MNISYGYYIWCDCGEYKEPEGTVFFSDHPIPGEKVILSDKKEWTITHVNKETMEATCELVEYIPNPAYKDASHVILFVGEGMPSIEDQLENDRRAT